MCLYVDSYIVTHHNGFGQQGGKGEGVVISRVPSLQKLTQFRVTTRAFTQEEDNWYITLGVNTYNIAIH